MMGNTSDENHPLECDWVTYKGRRVRSRIRRVRKKVVQSIEKRVSRSTLDEITEDDERAAKETIAKKESILAKAMDLTEDLSSLERKRETIKNEIKSLEKEVSCLDYQINSIRSSADFKGGTLYVCSMVLRMLGSKVLYRFSIYLFLHSF